MKKVINIVIYANPLFAYTYSNLGQWMDNETYEHGEHKYSYYSSFIKMALDTFKDDKKAAEQFIDEISKTKTIDVFNKYCNTINRKIDIIAPGWQGSRI